MPSTNSFLFKNSGFLISPALYGLKTEVKSPQIVLRQSLMLVSVIFFPVFLVKKCSRNWRVEVWSNTSEFTYPPLLHGEAITSGTRKPRPMEHSRSNGSGKP